MMQGLKVASSIALLGVVASCGGGGARNSTATSLAPLDPASAVRGFMDAAAAGNITAMAGLWGTRDGLAANRMSQDELVRRLTVMKTYLQHDRYELENVTDALMQTDERRIIDVRMWHRGCESQIPFTVVRARDGWLVQGVDLAAITSPARSCSQGG